jgi:hypothetical protein
MMSIVIITLDEYFLNNILMKKFYKEYNDKLESPT